MKRSASPADRDAGKLDGVGDGGPFRRGDGLDGGDGFVDGGALRDGAKVLIQQASQGVGVKVAGDR